jgi:selenocysteine lyase/cysteine desulfurase
MLGPEGLGFFYVRPELRDSLKLTQFGWHMVEAVGDFDAKTWQPAASARRFECGSPNMLAIHALSASLSLLLETGMERVESLVLENSRYLFEQLSAIPGVELITPKQAGRFAGIVTFSVSGQDNAEIQQQLHAKRVFCACRGGGIRFSPHFYTPQPRMESALKRLRNIIH